MAIPNIAELRELAGLTQVRAARLAGISGAFLSQIETGEITAPSALLRRIRAVLVPLVEKRQRRIFEVLASVHGRGKRDENTLPPAA
jgi:transcriptional regulator with XRE-family HTH domain